MPRDQYMCVYLWLTVLFYDSFLNCFIESVTALSAPSSVDARTPNTDSHITTFKEEDGMKHEDFNKEPSREYSGSKTVPRKGVSLQNTESDLSASKAPLSGNSKLSENDKIISISRTEIENTPNSSIDAIKNTLTIQNETHKLAKSSSAKTPFDKKSVYKATDDSCADYDSNNYHFSSKPNRFVPTFSITVFVLSLIVLIFFLFYKLKYKFSVRRNYTRVDYLIDGMYID